MTGNVHELRPKGADSEKITINLGYVDLGHVDLLVREGFYSNRTDFIRTAIRNQLDRHADALKRSADRRSLDLGLRHYTREDLEAARAAGRRRRVPRGATPGRPEENGAVILTRVRRHPALLQSAQLAPFTIPLDGYRML